MSPQLLATLRTLRRELACQYGHALGFSPRTAGHGCVGPWAGTTRLYVYNDDSYGPCPPALDCLAMGMPVADLWPVWLGN